MRAVNIGSIIAIIANIILSIWFAPRAGLWFAFFLSFVGGAVQPIIIAWGQELMRHDAQLRQLLVATGNLFTYTFSAWLQVVLFQRHQCHTTASATKYPSCLVLCQSQECTSCLTSSNASAEFRISFFFKMNSVAWVEADDSAVRQRRYVRVRRNPGMRW